MKFEAKHSRHVFANSIAICGQQYHAISYSVYVFQTAFCKAFNSLNIFVIKEIMINVFILFQVLAFSQIFTLELSVKCEKFNKM